MKPSHDISAGVVRLDFNLLLRTVQIAVGGSKAACEREISRIQHASIYGKPVSGIGYGDHRQMRSCAEQLATYAEQLALATAALDALEHSREREELVIKRDQADMAANVIPLKLAA